MTLATQPTTRSATGGGIPGRVLDPVRIPGRVLDYATIPGRVLDHALHRPDAAALVAAGRGGTVETVSYGELWRRAEAAGAALEGAGLEPGDRVWLCAPPAPDLYAVLLALLARGQVAVAIEGRRGLRRLLRAARAAGPAAVALPFALLRLRPPAFRRWNGAREALRPLPLDPEAPAILGFTSGTGGEAKAVLRSHGCLAAQHAALGRAFPPIDGERCLAFFPLVALHQLACGVTAVLPPPWLLDPARLDADRFAKWIEEREVTSVAAPPAILETVVERAARNGLRLRGVRRVVCGGGPVPPRLCEAILTAFPDAHGRVVYGSTEAEPIAQAAMAEVALADGDGLLVGPPVPEAEVVLVAPDREARVSPVAVAGRVPDAAGEACRVRPGEVGEVVVRGPHVARGGPAAGWASPSDDTAWRRTGDLARMDTAGRLWLVGRVGDVVPYRGRAVHPLPIEVAAAGLPGVRRAALVAHAGAPEGELAIEVAAGEADDVAVPARALLRARGLGGIPIRIVPRIPMDRRHRSKVDRPALRRALERGATGRVPPAGRATDPPAPASVRHRAPGAPAAGDRDELAGSLDLSTLRYAQVWEDHRLAERGLGVGPGDDVLSIASGGCNVLALLLRRPRSVTAVDQSPAQTALVHLKLAAIRTLAYDEYVALLGYRDRPAGRLPLYARLREAMPATAREFWDDRPGEIDAGVCHAGRLERFFRAFQVERLQAIHPPEVVRRFFAFDDLATQRAWFRDEFANSLLEAEFREWFDIERIAAEGRDPAQSRWVEEPDVAGVFWRRFRRACESIPARTNPYLEWFLTSEWRDLELAPPALRRREFAALRGLLPRVRVVTASLEEVLDQARPGAFSRANLSDVFEYLSPETSAALFERLARVIRPGGRVCWWELLVPRPCPAALRDRLRPLTNLARPLARRDRSWFYRNFHVEEVIR